MTHCGWSHLVESSLFSTALSHRILSTHDHDVHLLPAAMVYPKELADVWQSINSACDGLLAMVFGGPRRAPVRLVSIRNARTRRFLDGKSIGALDPTLASAWRTPTTDVYLLWVLGETSDDRVYVRSASSGRYLDGRAPDAAQPGLSSSRSDPQTNEALQWRIEATSSGEVSLTSVASRKCLAAVDKSLYLIQTMPEEEEDDDPSAMWIIEDVASDVNMANLWLPLGGRLQYKLAAILGCGWTPENEARIAMSLKQASQDPVIGPLVDTFLVHFQEKGSPEMSDDFRTCVKSQVLELLALRPQINAGRVTVAELQTLAVEAFWTIGQSYVRNNEQEGSLGSKLTSDPHQNQLNHRRSHYDNDKGVDETSDDSSSDCNDGELAESTKKTGGDLEPTTISDNSSNPPAALIDNLLGGLEIREGESTLVATAGYDVDLGSSAQQPERLDLHRDETMQLQLRDNDDRVFEDEFDGSPMVVSLAEEDDFVIVCQPAVPSNRAKTCGLEGKSHHQPPLACSTSSLGEDLTAFPIHELFSSPDFNLDLDQLLPLSPVQSIPRPPATQVHQVTRPDPDSYLHSRIRTSRTSACLEGDTESEFVVVNAHNSSPEETFTCRFRPQLSIVVPSSPAESPPLPISSEARLLHVLSGKRSTRTDVSVVGSPTKKARSSQSKASAQDDMIAGAELLMIELLTAVMNINEWQDADESERIKQGITQTRQDPFIQLLESESIRELLQHTVWKRQHEAMERLVIPHAAKLFALRSQSNSSVTEDVIQSEIRRIFDAIGKETWWKGDKHKNDEPAPTRVFRDVSHLKTFVDEETKLINAEVVRRRSSIERKRLNGFKLPSPDECERVIQQRSKGGFNEWMKRLKTRGPPSARGIES